MIIYIISVCQSWKFKAHPSSKKFPFQGATPHFKVETWISYLNKSWSLDNFLYRIAKPMRIYVAFSISYSSDLLSCLSEKLHLLEEYLKSIASKWRKHRASDLLYHYPYLPLMFCLKWWSKLKSCLFCPQDNFDLAWVVSIPTRFWCGCFVGVFLCVFSSHRHYCWNPFPATAACPDKNTLM